MELKSESAVRSVPAGNWNGAYESATMRQKQQLEVNFMIRLTRGDTDRTIEISQLLLIRRILRVSTCHMGVCRW
jgi:hypothetical protein